MPGLVNLHAHLELPHLLERVCAKTFPDWIINLIRAKKDLSNKNYQSATRININTLIQTGTTTVGEICTHGVSPALLKQSGIRSTVFHEIISMNTSLEPDHLSSLIAHSSSRMREGLSPHSPYTVSESALSAIHQFARKKDVRLSMHIAESKDEINLLQRYKSGLERLYRFAQWDLHQAPRGISSFDYLKRIGFLCPRLLAVHAVQVTGKDIKLIRKSKVSIAHCPRSNKEIGVEKMPLKKFLDAGITVGLGTDSLASSPSLNMWDEMRYAHLIHRRSGISAEDIFRLATINGAKAFGLDKEIGTLERGKKADIVAVPLPEKDTGDIYSDLLRETKSCIMTMVDGKILFQGSRKAI
jgi:cytosine/adenosine deaminase-related metal-dependent hydrolase